VVAPTHDELQLEERIRQYIHWRHARAVQFGEKTPAFALTTFQKLACSSSRAAAAAIENRIRKLAGSSELEELTDDVELATQLEQMTLAGGGAHDEELLKLQQLRDAARGLTDSKLLELDQALTRIFREAPDEKVLIFTQFLATQEMIRERLRTRFETVVFNGGLKLEEKDAAVRAFRDRANVMISTEAGGEGRNFQFCHLLVNYDLPWNPMRIEQRIGRVDRVGQKRNVIVYNFQVSGTLDERILNVLEHRVRVFTESVGALEPILGDIEHDLDEICVRAVADANAAIERYELDLEEKLDRARRQEAQLQDLVMDSRSLRRDAVDELLGRAALVTPDHLRAFVIAAISRYPSAVVADLPGGALRVEVPAMLRQGAGLDESYVGSFDYRLALADERLEFFAFGHPLVEALISETERVDFAPSPGVLITSADEPLGLIVDYELRLTGVRDRTVTFSQFVRDTDISAAPRLGPSPDKNLAVAVPPLPAEVVSEIEQRSRKVAQDQLDSELADYTHTNAVAYDSEVARVKKRFAFERRRHDQRIQNAEAEIALLERYGGGPDVRRAIGAYRGIVTRAKRRLDELKVEEGGTFVRLESQKIPTSALRVVGVTRVMAA
jgi:helicase-like protein